MSWTIEQIRMCVDGLQRSVGDERRDTVDWVALGAYIARVAHHSHSDWAQTRHWSRELAEIVGTPRTSKTFCRMFRRVLTGGGWSRGEAAVAARTRTRLPWLVLVAGLNGIRKTTSVNSSWFSAALLASNAAAFNDGVSAEVVSDPPCGERGFFRQLDFMIATLASEEFRKLYANFGAHDVDAYARRKSEIFSQYRTMAEILGVLLVDEALGAGMDVFAETSGRSASSFSYVDFLAATREGAEGTRTTTIAATGPVARKLVVRFDVSDVSHAERSVAVRMQREIAEGQRALERGDHDDLLLANRGGA